MEKLLKKEEREYMEKFASRFWAEIILADERFKRRNLTEEEAGIVAERWLAGMDDVEFHAHFLKAYMSVFEDTISKAIDNNKVGGNNLNWPKWR